MAINLLEIANQEESLTPGHRLCSGCAESVVVRQVLHAIKGPVVVANATGCLQVGTSIFPYSSWRIPWIHNTFENAASTLSGVETMYRSLVKQGKMEDKGIQFVAFGGDGATYDIGLQFLSGALERGHKMLYVCLNNEAYMNTGTQRSSATPRYTWTTTTPIGKTSSGKQQHRKDLTAIVAAHGIPFIAQASPSHWRDLMTKVQKAISADGPSFINVLAPCPRGWRYETEESIDICRVALDTLVWQLYEVNNGVYKINYRPRKQRPIIDWLKAQGRFRHLLKPEFAPLVEELQHQVDQEWARLERLAANPA